MDLSNNNRIFFSCSICEGAVYTINNQEEFKCILNHRFNRETLLGKQANKIRRNYLFTLKLWKEKLILLNESQPKDIAKIEKVANKIKLLEKILQAKEIN